MLRDVDIPTSRSGTLYGGNTKTYLVMCIFLLFAAIQWYFVLSFIHVDITDVSTVMLIVALFLVSVFHMMPALRHAYPYNYLFVVIIVELMILGTGALTSCESVFVMFMLTGLTLFVWFILLVVGIVLQQHYNANPLCFITTIFFNFLISVVLMNTHLIAENMTLVFVTRIIICYSIVSVVVYHSMVIHNRESHMFEDDYLLSAVLLFVDYTCLFMITMMVLNHAKFMPVAERCQGAI